MRCGSWITPFFLLAAACCGCGVDELATPTAVRMRGLAVCYMDYAVTNGGRGPASEAVLKKHMQAMPDFVLDSNGLDAKNIEAAFHSDRDQEAFVIRYGQGISLGFPNPGVLIHEQTGKNGKRLAALANAEMELIDESRFKELTAE